MLRRSVEPAAASPNVRFGYLLCIDAIDPERQQRADSTRQLMDVLGDSNIAHAELYSRDADQIRLAVEGIEKAVSLCGFEVASFAG